MKQQAFVFLAFLVIATACSSEAGDEVLVIPPAPTTDTEASVTLVDSPLLTSNRTERAFCVGVVGDTVLTASTLANVELALERFSDDLASSEYPDPVLSLGCPKAAIDIDTQYGGFLRNGPIALVGGPKLVPSTYTGHIYVMTQGDYEGVFGDLPTGRTREEDLCEFPLDHECAAGVTFGIYITAETPSENVHAALKDLSILD